MIGIYKITNDITGKVYIGQSLDIFRRWREHQSYSLYCELSPDDWHIDLYNNPQNYSFKIIELCQEEELDFKEAYWINYYDSYRNGLNKKSGNSSKKIFPKEKRPYKRYKTHTIEEVIDRFIDKPLGKEEKNVLCELMNLRGKDGALLKWTSVKKELISKGFKIEDKRKTVDGKKISVSIITR